MESEVMPAYETPSELTAPSVSVKPLGCWLPLTDIAIALAGGKVANPPVSILPLQLGPLESRDCAVPEIVPSNWTLKERSLCQWSLHCAPPPSL